jgi:glucose/mannose-6-phosphate isomerase
MNLDDLTSFSVLDTQNMLAQIEGLPGQLAEAWEIGHRSPLPDWQGLRQVIIAGMGGSAIGGDLLSAYIETSCRVPVIVHRDYDLPAWGGGSETLVIAASHSGNTEETLSAFERARANGCRILAISTGGKLAVSAHEAGAAAWSFNHKGQPRSAVGYSFGLLLVALARLGLIPDPEKELRATIAAMQTQQRSLKVDIPVVKNPAKRIAGQLMGRWVTVFGAGALVPVARRWKGQLNEVAKAWGQFEALPEGDHNTIAGTLYPQEQLQRLIALFLDSPTAHPRHQLRSQLTRKTLMLEGINTDTILAQGNTPLENQWTALHFGDYTAFYLAMAYGVDPTPVETIEGFKKELKAATGG